VYSCTYLLSGLQCVCVDYGPAVALGLLYMIGGGYVLPSGVESV
jgi:hypothetical protein